MTIRPLNRAQRIASIEQILFHSPEGLRVVELAQQAGVDRRTIYRDLLEMVKLGIPITQKEGRFYINRDYHSVSLRLNLNEVLSLFIAARLWLRRSPQTNPYILSGAAKLAAAFPTPLSDHAQQLLQMLHGSAIDRHFVHILEILAHGCAGRRQVRLWVAPTDASEIYACVFEPYLMDASLQAGFYVVGRDERAQTLQSFRLEWIKRAKLTENTFEISKDFNPRLHLESDWGALDCEMGKTRVVLGFAPELKPLIQERMVHPSQRVEVHHDHWATLTVYVQDWHQILPWVRSWGSEVEVLEPEDLRLTLERDAKRLLRVYQGVKSER